MQLEWLARDALIEPVGGWHERYQFEWGEAPAIDTRPLIRAVAGDAAAGIAPAIIARRFHVTLADLICAVCEKVRQRNNLNTVVLTGGVFLNALLCEDVLKRLTSRQFRAYSHRQIPAGDGGLSFGQIVVGSSHFPY
jgi:hydrogenase maturation protein HypF